MKRRDFLIGGMGTLAAGITGCAGISQVIAPSWPNVTPLEIERFLIASDEAMNRVVENPDGGHAISKLQQKPMSEKDAQLFRQSMRSLLLVGNFGDLSVAGQVHPGVQKRLQYSASEMDAAVFGTMDQMKSLPPTARADIQSALSEDTTLEDRVLEGIDLEAAAVGASTRRRRQLHVMGKHIIRRLKHSSDMFINEYVTKCEKLTAVPGSVAETQRFMVARMGEAGFKARVQEAENAARHWQSLNLENIPIGYQHVANEITDNKSGADNSSQEQQPLDPLPKEQNKGKKPSQNAGDILRKRGQRVLGIGAITTGVGWIMIIIGGNNDLIELALWGTIPGITVGPALILAGLIMIVISGTL